MKIRSPILDKLVGVVGACLVRLWMGTVSFKVRCPVPQTDPGHPLHRGRYIYAFWHETILAMIGVRRIRNMSVLISRHQDGEYIAQIVGWLGVSLVRGSSRRGGRGALLRLLNEARANHLLITPDGPRGPRRHLQPGVVFLAERSGLPIVPVGFGFANAWRARSWDRFAVPTPYSSVTCVVGDPISVPAGLDDAERWQVRVEQALLATTAAAERLASGCAPPATYRRAA